MRQLKIWRIFFLFLIIITIFLQNFSFISLYSAKEKVEMKINGEIFIASDENLNYSKKWIFDFGGISLSQNIKIYPDLNNDGFDDIILTVQYENSTKVYALSHNGDIIWNTTDFRLDLVTYNGDLIRSFGENAWYLPQIYDENGDGVMDILGDFLNNNSGILDGKTGDILWTGNPFGARNSIVGLLNDFTGDGNPEILMKNNNDYGVLNSSSKTMIWSNTYAYSPHLNPIPDIDGDGIWDVITAANYVDRIECWSGANGSSLWSHPIGYDSWGEAICPDQNSDGYYDVLVTPQSSEFELISGKTGSQIWGSSNARTAYPDYIVDENLNKYTMHADDGIIKTYYLSNGTYIGEIPSSSMTSSHSFLSNSYYTSSTYQLIFLSNGSIGLYVLGNYNSPSQMFNENYSKVSPYYGNNLTQIHDLVFTNESHFVFYTEPLSVYEAEISNGNKKPNDNILLFIAVPTTGILILMIGSLYLVRRRKTRGEPQSSNTGALKKPNMGIAPSKSVTYTIYLSCSELDFELYNIPEIASRLELNPEIEKVKFKKIGETKMLGTYIENTLKESNVFLLFCSSHTINSKKIQREWHPAFQQRKVKAMKMIQIFKRDEHIPVLLLALPKIKFKKRKFDKFIIELSKEIIGNVE